MAHQLVYKIARCLAPRCLLVYSSDGLALSVYDVTADFGAWVQAADERRRAWCVDARLLYARVVKHCRRNSLTEVRRHVLLGQPEAFRLALIPSASLARFRLTSWNGSIWWCGDRWPASRVAPEAQGTRRKTWRFNLIGAARSLTSSSLITACDRKSTHLPAAPLPITNHGETHGHCIQIQLQSGRFLLKGPPKVDTAIAL